MGIAAIYDAGGIIALGARVTLSHRCVGGGRHCATFATIGSKVVITWLRKGCRQIMISLSIKANETKLRTHR